MNEVSHRQYRPGPPSAISPDQVHLSEEMTTLDDTVRDRSERVKARVKQAPPQRIQNTAVELILSPSDERGMFATQLNHKVLSA
jgi:hypothetical protein